MRCEEIMKRSIECVAPDDNVQQAARRMRDANVGFLPVCDPDNKVIGTLTDRDIVIRLVADDRPANTPVGAVMTQQAVSCRASDDITQAMRRMRENHVSRILCCDESDRLVGIISLSDLVQIAEAEGAETLREVSEREARP